MTRRAAQGEAAPRRPRRRAARGQGERLREEILAAAERLLAQTGDQEAVSIRGVAEAVGVTPPSIYLHFADKNELIFAVCEQGFGELDARVEEAVAGAADPLDALYRRGRAYIQFGLDHPEQYRILFMTKPQRVPEQWTPERLLQTAAFGHLVGAVQTALDAGALRPADPLTIAVTLWAGVHGITSLLISHPGHPWPPLDGLLDHLLRSLMFGVADPAALP